MFFNYGPLKLNKKKWLRPPAKSYKGGYCFDKSNLPSPWTSFLTTRYVFSLLLDSFFIQCKGPQCQLMWLVHLKEVVYLVYIWRYNLAHRKYSFDLFLHWIGLACTYVLSKKYESRVVIRRSRSILARSGLLVNRIFPVLLAPWTRQWCPCTWVNVSLIVLISKSDKKEEHFQVYFDRSILYPDGVQ